MSQKERDRLSLALCIVPRHSACHLTFDCGNLSLHLHGLIFSTHVGSCHGIEFSCHYMGPPVLLLSHYPIASVRMYTGLSSCVCMAMKQTHMEYLVLDQDSTRSKCLWSNHAPRSPTYPLMSPLKARIMHEHTHTRTHGRAYSCACNAGIAFCLTISLSVLHTRSSVLVAMHMSPASNTSDFLQSFTVSDTVLFPMWALQSQKWEPTFLASHTPNFCPPAASLITGFPSGLPEVFFYFIAVCPYASKPQCLYVH